MMAPCLNCKGAGSFKTHNYLSYRVKCYSCNGTGDDAVRRKFFGFDSTKRDAMKDETSKHRPGRGTKRLAPKPRFCRGRVGRA